MYFPPLRIDYCDEGLDYQNDDISGIKGGTCTCNISIKSPIFSLLNDMA